VAFHVLLPLEREGVRWQSVGFSHFS
jgi:hypothetical protein